MNTEYPQLEIFFRLKKANKQRIDSTTRTVFLFQHQLLNKRFCGIGIFFFNKKSTFDGVFCLCASGFRVHFDFVRAQIYSEKSLVLVCACAYVHPFQASTSNQGTKQKKLLSICVCDKTKPGRNRTKKSQQFFSLYLVGNTTEKCSCRCLFNLV